MIGLRIQFLAGRFHANAWHHAHNEGVSEWPPSPWRVLRALVASAYELGVDPGAAAPLLEKLQALPRYRLPAAREAHTRHYMPDVDDAAHKKTKVFDTFVAIDGGAGAPQPVTIVWPGTLLPTERALLEQLAGRVSYLGRAESWAAFEVVDPQGDRFDCWPDERAEAVASTVLMTPEPPDAFSSWASAQPTPKRKGSIDVPRSLWDVLTFTGERFRDEGWTRVPGTRLSRYIFGGPPFRGPSAIATSRRNSARARPTVAQFAMRSAVLPRLTDALSVGERVRAALMSKSGATKVVFSGHAEQALEHRHAFYLSGSNDAGRIDHIIVSATMGFDEDDVRALQNLRRVWGHDGHDISILLTGLWTESEVYDIGARATPLLGDSRVWSSLTPFVPTRHPKLVRGVEVDGIADQIRLACRRLGRPEPIEVTRLETPQHHETWSRFQRRRRNGGGRRGPDLAYGARLVFAEPLRGPLALGYGAHFGLGAFVAEG